MANQKKQDNALADAKKRLDEAQEKFNEVNATENAESYTAEEREAAKADLEDAKMLVEQIESKARPAQIAPPDPTKTASRKFHTISCVNAFGMYPKLGLKFRNGIALVSDEKLQEVKESSAWKRQILYGTQAVRTKDAVRVVKAAAGE